MSIDLISVNAFTCEKIMVEEDGVTSAIRLVDIFMVEQSASLPITLPVQLLVLLKSKDIGTFSFSVLQRNPDGSEVPLGLSLPPELITGRNPKYPQALPGQTIRLRLNLVCGAFGTYAFVVLVDGKVETTTEFTLTRRPSMT